MQLRQHHKPGNSEFIVAPVNLEKFILLDTLEKVLPSRQFLHCHGPIEVTFPLATFGMPLKMRLTDDFVGTFVKGDNDDVLAHLTLVSGLCLRSSNLGKLLILLLAFSFTYAVSTAFPFM